MKNIRAIKNILFLSLVTFTAYSFNNNQKIEDILIGMTMKSVCKINSDNFRKREDPCHGYFQYFHRYSYDNLDFFCPILYL